ncbi:MAG: electron transport complex subunit E [Firmicutes bacterium]|nr:electron transport complex subunit E [Bacillota bacterium]
MNKYVERLYNGLIKENPTLMLMLGMCPTLAVSTRAMNGIGMGLSTTAVLILSNLIISLLRKVIPDEVRLPSYIVIVASLVTVTELLIEGYLPSLYSALGIYIPLIVVNCIILGRAEAYANKNGPLLSVMDGLGMGLGFTLALTLAGFVRELLGNGSVFGVNVLPDGFEPIGIFVQPPGAFLVIALFVTIMNAIGIKTRQRQLVESGCDGCCSACMSPCENKDESAPDPAEARKEAQI